MHAYRGEGMHAYMHTYMHTYIHTYMHACIRLGRALVAAVASYLLGDTGIPDGGLELLHGHL